MGRQTILYQAQNKLNGKRYVGITVRGLVVRKRRHLVDAKAGSPLPLHRALAKNGRDQFDWTVLETFASQEEAAEAEKQHIAMFKPEYNISPGGAMGPFPINAETVDRIARANWKAVICLDTGQVFESCKAAQKFCGRPVAAVVAGHDISANGYHFEFYTRPLSQKERAEKIAVLQSRKAARFEKLREARRRAVICVNDGNRFESGAAAARHYGLHQVSVSECTLGKIIHTNGLRFSFVDDFDNGRFDPDRKKKKPSNCRPVRCLNDGDIFESVSAAARKYGITNLGNLRQVCSGKRWVVQGLRFAYHDNGVTNDSSA